MFVDKKHMVTVRENGEKFNLELEEVFVDEDGKLSKGNVKLLHTVDTKAEALALKFSFEEVYALGVDTEEKRSEVKMTEKFASDAKKVSARWEINESGSVEIKLSYVWNDIANMYHNDAEDLKKELFN